MVSTLDFFVLLNIFPTYFEKNGKLIYKVVRIWEKRSRDVTLLQGVENTWILRIFRAAEKSQEKFEANNTGLSAEFFGSQPVEIFCFVRQANI